MKSIETLIEKTFATADAEDRLKAADAAFVDTFLALRGEAQAARWRGLTTAEKSRLVVRRIEALGKDWTSAIVAEFIARYDAQFAAGPIDAAVEGALERLALQHADAARLADRLGDKAHRKSERAAATAFTNALIQYRAGVRPEILASGARLIPSSTPGKRAHLITMDGDWICNCDAGANMHWPLALCIGIEQAHDDMQAFDDGDADADLVAQAAPLIDALDTIHGDCDLEADADELLPPQWRIGAFVARRLAQSTCDAQRLLAQADALLETLRVRKAGLYGFTPRAQRLQRLYAAADRRYARRLAALASDPPCEPCPLGTEEGDSIPDARSIGARIAAARRNVVYAAY